MRLNMAQTAFMLALTLLPRLSGGATITVDQVAGRRFQPAQITIALGDTIKWVNADAMPHTTTSGPEGTPDGLFDSGNMDPGAVFSYTFTTVGTFPYYCDYHSGMVGSVNVLDNAVTALQVGGRQFQPVNLAIESGQTVIWINVDTMPHTTTSGPEGAPDGRFDSGNMDPGASFSYTFAAPGVYPYYCDYHAGMVGTVTVYDNAVTVKQLAGRVFVPATLSAQTGTTVIWRNDDTMPHTTTSGPQGMPDGRFDSGNMIPGDTFAYTFAMAGSYPYYCDYHPGMVGDVQVGGAGPAIELKLRKSGLDVILEWSGGSGPFDVLRGERTDLGDLIVIRSVAAGFTDTDPNAVPAPPSLYLYQVQ